MSDNIQIYDPNNLPSSTQKEEIASFLFQQLDQYGDPQTDIEKAMKYALSTNQEPGGFITAVYENGTVVCAVVVNKTGMKGYIPENILVYIATHESQRGKGIGKKAMQKVIEKADGDIALHVEPDNPAKRLYESLGFTNKYLEMRLKKGA